MINTDKIVNNLLATKTVIIITGPTASGKTGLSLELSKIIPIEVISADSRQIYRYMDIGTAKPNQDELKIVKHHFIDYLNPDEDYNAGKFGNEAEKIVLKILKNGKIPVVVGGSGLYIKSLCEGLFNQEENFALHGIRSFLSEKLKEKGKDYLYEELLKIDKDAAELYKDKNPRRVLRALEYYYTYGSSITQSRKKNVIKRDFKCKYLGINHERQALYDRINQRTKDMWRDGLVEETKNLLDMGYSPELNSLNTVGYKETIAYLQGKLSEDDAIAQIQRNTRRYAKRQITWFKKVSDIVWLNISNFESGKIPALEILKNLNI